MWGTGGLLEPNTAPGPPESKTPVAARSGRGAAGPLTVGRVLAGLTLLLGALLLPFVVFYAARAFHPQSIVFNEGWNAYHAERVIAGEPLYPPFQGVSWKPLNYPPLSFLVTALLNPVTHDPVRTGRILSYLSILGVAALVWSLVARAGRARMAAWLAAVVWGLLIAEFGGQYFGMNDPQLFGHLFSTGALLVYVRAQDDLDTRRLALIALLCTLALFTKLVLVAVPLTLVTMLLLRSPRRLAVFLGCCAAMAGLLSLVLWMEAGPAVVQNILGFERARPTENALLGRSIFLEKGGALFLAAAGLVWATRRRAWTFAPVYLVWAFAVGCYFQRGVVDVNAFFDLFIAAAVVIGLVAVCAGGSTADVTAAAERPGQPTGAPLLSGRHPPGQSDNRPPRERGPVWTRLGARIVLAALPLPFLLGLPGRLPGALDYADVERGGREFAQDVEVLRSVSGPVLVEDPLLALSAGKAFEVDLFATPRLIAAGYVPESTLVDPIREERFGAIVTYQDLEPVLAKLDQRPDGRPSAGAQVQIGGRAMGGRWTVNALREVIRHYRLVRHDSLYYFYVPVGPASG